MKSSWQTSREPTELVELGDRARRFASEYLVDFTVAKAAKRSGISVRAAYSYLDDPRVKALIADGRFRHSESVNASVAMVLSNLGKVATANIDEAIVALGGPADAISLSSRLAQLPEHVRYSIKTVEWTKHGLRIVMHDKISALIHLGKFLGMFFETVDQSKASAPPIKLIEPHMSAAEAAKLYQATLKAD
ncbi:MAG: terminase small subunit [Alphaproteobacteria bacterium]|nr:terminase small subunit [Alphaproteobacteria bacterium]MBU0804996.1 terminase small subunit [Alphaproteobacteria bacterium]MBU0870495.1 terminase small subunit [Alphaproteobacteria bacterium]MBU1401830.1 terminase small subunit [Alphaproteobacteria bacterium]MBU1591753.1 terminase small subunit [Alphaproteobacteria bacterium]